MTYLHSDSQEREEFLFAQLCAHLSGDENKTVEDFMPSRVAAKKAITSHAQAAEERFIASMASIGIKPDPT